MINFYFVVDKENCKFYALQLGSMAYAGLVTNSDIYIAGQEDTIEAYILVKKVLRKYDFSFHYIHVPALDGDTRQKVFINGLSILSSIDKVIFVEAYIMFRRGFEKINLIDLDGKIFAAVKNPGIDNADLLNKHSSREKPLIRNNYKTNVLVIDCVLLRELYLNKHSEYEQKDNEDLSSFLGYIPNEFFFTLKDTNFCSDISIFSKEEQEFLFYKSYALDYSNAIKHENWETWLKEIYCESFLLRFQKYLQDAEEKKLILRSFPSIGKSVEYVRYVLKSFTEKSFIASKIDEYFLLKKMGLWDDSYFIPQKKHVNYQKRFKQIIKGYSLIQVHFLFGMGAASFFLDSLMFLADNKDNVVLHIWIPNSFIYDPNKNKSFYVHNEFILSKYPNSFIPNNDERDFIKYILSMYLYKLDYSKKWIYSPGDYERVKRGDYREMITHSLIDFTSKELEEGNNYLNKNNLKKYVCLAPRNSSYKKTYKITLGANDYLGHRNTPLDNFIPAIEYLSNEGYSNVHTGKYNEITFPQKYKIPVLSDNYSAFLDVFLYSRCEFVIGDSSGTMILPAFFNKPTLQLNLEMITSKKEIVGYFDYGHDLIIPVRYKNNKTNTFLTLKQQLMLERKYKDIRFETQVLEDGYYPVRPSKEEILEAVKEMVEHIILMRPYSDEEKRIQQKYLSIVRWSADISGMFYAKCFIATSFVRKNSWYLE